MPNHLLRNILLIVLISLPSFAQDFSANAARRLLSPQRIRLNGLPVLIQSAKVWNDGETVTWNGIVDNPLPGSFSLAITGAIVAGNLSTASGDSYEISGTPDNLVYTQVETTKPFLCPVVPAPTPVSSKAAAQPPRQVDAVSEIDILVVYTAAVKNAFSGPTGALNAIRSAVSFTNQAFANSGVPTVLNLVGIKEVPLSESGSCGFDLAQLTNQSSVNGSLVQSLRNETGADLVSLLIADGDCGGIGYLLTNTVGSPNAGLSVTAINAPNRNYTFAHEIGHNLGANHDRANAGPSPGLFSYSYGFQNTTAEPFFRDLMAYNCIGVPCPRQPFFSTPKVNVFNRPIGIADPATNSADAAATFVLSAPIVANYRPRNPNPDPNNVAPSFSVSPSELSAPVAGTTLSVSIRSNVSWSATSNTGWLAFPNTFGDAGITTLSIRVPPNRSLGNRYAYIEVRGDGIFGTIQLNQAGVEASFSSSGFVAAATATSGQVTLTLSDQSYPWTATLSSNSGWLSISPLSGVGSRTLNFSIPVNTTGLDRYASLSIENFANFNILQANANTIPVGPIVTLPAGGGSLPFPIATNSPGSLSAVNAFSLGDWLSVTPSSGSGDRITTLSALPNFRSADRRGTVAVGSQIITVTQRGQRCTLSTPIALGAIVRAALAATPACGSSYLSDPTRVAYTNRYTFSATAGQSVRILLDSTVLDSVLYLTGPNGELLFDDDNSGGGNNAAIPNTSNFLTLPLAGTYTIEATSYSLGEYTLRLLEGTSPTATLLPQSLSVPYTAGSGTLALNLSPVSLDWTAAVSAAGQWLQLTASRGSGNSTLTYSYFANPSTAPRIATIQVAGQTFTLTQAAAPTPPRRPGAALYPITGPDTRDSGPLFSVSKNPKLVFQFSHSAGFDKLDVVNVLVNSALDGDRACYVAYSRSANVLYLVDDGGPEVGASALALGTNATVSNGQCTVYGNESSGIGTGNTLTLTLRVDFKPAFAGRKVIYLAARDAESGNSGWKTHGGIAIPDLPNTFPRSGAIFPSNGDFFQSLIRIAYQHEGSSSNLETVWALMNSAVDARNACYVAYFAPGKLLLLLPDDGDATKAQSMRIPGNSTLENSQCQITGQTSSAATADGELILFLQVLFKGPFQQTPFGIWTAAQTLATPGKPAKTSPWSMVGGWLPYRTI